MMNRVVCTAVAVGAVWLVVDAEEPVRFRNAAPSFRSTAATPGTAEAAVKVLTKADKETKKRVTIVTPAVPLAATTPAPGVYKAEPYRMIVVVPAPIDAKIAFGSGSNTGKPPEVIQPPLRLVPR